MHLPRKNPCRGPVGFFSFSLLVLPTPPQRRSFTFGFDRFWSSEVGDESILVGSLIDSGRFFDRFRSVLRSIAVDFDRF